uniref:solute carrier family 2, facilitated glucose transporter member 9-like n=1 Tax=Styela clava TaxID=7725 RepID=UPI001939FBC0|nr:solute carrier family 2, facilitated glucose transporter member 9-like [Styela clava]
MKGEYKNSWYCTFVLNASIFPTAFMIAYSIACLNPLVPVIQRIYNSTYEKQHGDALPDDTWTLLLTLTMSMLMIGAFVGSMVFKILLKYLTRKRILILTHICSATGYLIVAVGTGKWGSPEAFIIGRFVTGIALGLGLSVTPLIFNESCVPHRRTFYGGVWGIATSSGVPIGIFFAWPKIFGTDERWLGVLFVCMFFSIVYTVCSFWIIETPLQALILHGEGRALTVLRKLRCGTETDLNDELKDLVADGASDDNANSVATFKEVITTPQYRRHFIGAVLAYSIIMACGVNNIFFYSDQILSNAGLDSETVTPATLGVMIVGPIVSVVLTIFVNRGAEPRIVMIVGCTIMIFGDAFMTACLATSEDVPAMSTAAIAAVCVFYIGFAMINLVGYVMFGAITIDRTRPVCINVGAASLWFFAWLVGFIAPYFEIWIGPYGFLVWMVLTIAVLLYTIFLIPNIAGKTPDQIQAFYKTGLATSASSVPLDPEL